MADNTNLSFGCFPSIFEFILFVVFLVLRLCEVIDWSWWWITAPLWAGFALRLIVFVITVLIAAWIGSKKF